MRMKTWPPWMLAPLVGLLALGLQSSPVHAEPVEDDLQNWDMVTFQGPIHGKVLGYMEAQARFSDNLSEVNRTLLRPAVGYQVTKHLSLWQGYAWTPEFNGINDEHRLFQQALLTHKAGKFDLVNRTRMEERFINNAGGTAYRLRHMVRGTHPLGHSEKWYVTAYDELFWNMNDTITGPQAGFDQNRLFVGVGKRLTPHVKLEGGYIANYVNRYVPTPDRLNHVILVTLSINW